MPTARSGVRSTRRVNPDGGTNRAGMAWYIVNPASGKVVYQGYLAAAGATSRTRRLAPRRAAVASWRSRTRETVTNPSAAYAPIDALAGAGAWTFAGPGGGGAAVDDGFTSYKSQVGNPPRTRWGDYGAAAVDGNSIWIASEYIAHACDYATWGGPFFGAATGDNMLGTCGAAPRPRAAGCARQLVDTDQQADAVTRIGV